MPDRPRLMPAVVIRLVDMLPPLDMTWPDALQAKWFACYEGLWRMVLDGGGDG